ncbi:hypothetical protein L6R53_11815 [Myxococcota bacterium]|nr:hypothetical protein [Myxococcota bacterium]
MSERPRVLLATPDARERLRLLSALRDLFELMPLAPGEDPLRACRAQRPAAVLLSVPRHQVQNTLRACRAIKTDAGAPPCVALVDPSRRLSHPDQAVQASLADGYLGLELPDEELVAFVRAVLAGERPVRAGEAAPRGLLDRLLRR